MLSTMVGLQAFIGSFSGPITGITDYCISCSTVRTVLIDHWKHRRGQHITVGVVYHAVLTCRSCGVMRILIRMGALQLKKPPTTAKVIPKTQASLFLWWGVSTIYRGWLVLSHRCLAWELDVEIRFAWWRTSRSTSANTGIKFKALATRLAAVAKCIFLETCLAYFVTSSVVYVLAAMGPSHSHGFYHLSATGCAVYRQYHERKRPEWQPVTSWPFIFWRLNVFLWIHWWNAHFLVSLLDCMEAFRTM